MNKIMKIVLSVVILITLYQNVLAAPTKPIYVESTCISSTQINISWKATSDDTQGYNVYRCQGYGCMPDVVITAVDTNSFADKNVDPNTHYRYLVKSYDVNGDESESSDIIDQDTISSGYNLPVGIPDPGFGINEQKPNRPSDWIQEVAGFYYVEDVAGCSTTLTYGFPGNPICHMPNPIPAGSYVEVHGVVTYTTAGTIQIHGDGTSDNPIWVVGESEENMPIFTDQVLVFGSYIYLEHLHSQISGLGTSIIISTSSHDGYEADHIMVRNCLLEEDSTDRSHGVSVSSYYDGDETTDYVLIVNNTMRNFGQLDPQPEYDQDAHVIAVNKASRNVWIMGNIIYNAGGSGLSAGQEGPLWGYTDNQWIYAGHNHVYNTLQAALSVKGVWHVVFSENVARDQVTRWQDGVVGGTVASPSKCFGWKGEPQDYWIINNKCYGDSYGIHGGATVDYKQFNIYIIGNTFKDIQPNKPDEFTGTNTWGEAAISMIRGGYVYAINNSIDNACAGITAAGPGGDAADLYHYYIENNIMRNIGYAHMIIGSRDSPDNTKVTTNIIYQPDNSGELVRWGSNDYNLEEFKVATGEAQNTVVVDPGFINIDAGDFDLRPNSYAIDRGVADNELLTNVFDVFQSIYGKDIRFDLDRVSRPEKDGWDIGAYEYVDIRADVDQNSAITSTDAMLTIRNSLGLDMLNTNWQSSTTTGDVNCDGVSNSTDAMLILRHSLGLNMDGTGWCVE